MFFLFFKKQKKQKNTYLNISLREFKANIYENFNFYQCFTWFLWCMFLEVSIYIAVVFIYDYLLFVFLKIQLIYLCNFEFMHS